MPVSNSIRLRSRKINKLAIRLKEWRRKHKQLTNRQRVEAGYVRKHSAQGLCPSERRSWKGPTSTVHRCRGLHPHTPCNARVQADMQFCFDCGALAKFHTDNI